MARAVPGPGQLLDRIEHGNVGGGARVRFDQGRKPGSADRGVLRHEPAAKFVGIAYRGGETDRAHTRREPAQARQAQRQQIAPFRRDE